MAFVFYCISDSVLPWQRLVCYGSGSCLMAAVGLVDDLRSLPNTVRFVFQSISALIFCLGFGWWEGLRVPGFVELSLGWLGFPVTFLWIVGFTNAFNFMDGIDGIAVAQCVVAGLGWAILGILTEMSGPGILGALLAATTLGFLGHNWSPARIFMGDAGSMFLGYNLACLAVMEPGVGSASLAGVLFVWPFIFDTVFTFFRRLKNGENVFAAHRSHLYQRLVITGLSHRAVSLLYAGLAALGVCLGLLLTAENIWLDLTIVALLPLACIFLWGFTVVRERKHGKQPKVIEEKSYAKVSRLKSS